MRPADEVCGVVTLYQTGAPAGLTLERDELQLLANALALLRAHTHAHQTTLSDIAGAVVERRLSFLGP